MRFLQRVGLPLVIAALLVPGSAWASWLGLADGTYDVTLEPSVLLTGVSGYGSLTIQGNGVSDWNIHLSDLPADFTGDPIDSDMAGGTSQGTLTLPHGLGTQTYALKLETDIWIAFNPPGMPPPEDFGQWTATLQAPVSVPEPGAIGLTMLGLIGLIGARMTSTLTHHRIGA